MSGEKSEIADLRMSNAHLVTDNEKKQQRIDTLTERLEVAGQEYIDMDADYEFRIKAQEKRITELESENAKQRKSIDGLVLTMSDDDETIGDLQKKNARLESMLTSVEDDNQELVYDCRDYRIKLERYKANPVKFDKVWAKYRELENIYPDSASGIPEIGASFIYTAGFAEGMMELAEAKEELERYKWIPLSDGEPDIQVALMWNPNDGTPVIEEVGIDDWPFICSRGGYTHWTNLPPTTGIEK